MSNPQGQSSERQPIGFFAGKVLLQLAGIYPSLFKVVLELVQNSLDAKAKKIKLLVDFSGRRIVITDDGKGVTDKKINDAFMSIGCSVKGETDLGEFGIGLFAGMGKCLKMIMTSRGGSGDREYLRWTFDFVTLEKQKVFNGVPLTYPKIRWAKGANRRESGYEYVDWSTKIELVQFTTDRMIAKIDINSLAEAILGNFQHKMRLNEASIDIEIINETGRAQTRTLKADEYRGEPLDKYCVKADVAGQVVFDLYKTKPGIKGYEGKISLGVKGDVFRLTSKSFLASVRRLLSKEVVDALASGVFEGDIIAEKISLNANRVAFNHNDALVDFCLVIEEWYKQIGKTIVETANEEARDNRHQNMLLKALRAISPAIEKVLPGIYDGFRFGHIGDGHVDRKGAGETKRGKSVDGGGGRPKTDKPNPDDPTRDRKPPTNERPDHKPVIALGPEGKKRKMVSTGSKGFQLGCASLPSGIFELDIETGTIIINNAHPWFAFCDKKATPTALERYMEEVLIGAVTLYVTKKENPPAAAALESSFKLGLSLKLPHIVNGDVLAGRRHGELREIPPELFNVL